MRNRDFSRIAAIWVKVPEIPEPDQLDSQTGSSRPSRGRVRVRSGQIRAHCTRNARQEANLNKQHKQRTTPTAFYDAAIRHSRFPIRHIIISGTQVPYLRLCLCLGFSHGPRCVCVCVWVLSCVPLLWGSRNRSLNWQIPHLFFAPSVCVSVLRSQRVSMMGIYVFPPIDCASEPAIASCFRGLDQLTWWQYTPIATAQPSPVQLSSAQLTPTQPTLCCLWQLIDRFIGDTLLS